MWYAEWPNILVVFSMWCIQLVWRAQCDWLYQKKTLNLYKFYYIYTPADHFYWLYKVSASNWNLLVCRISQFFFPRKLKYRITCAAQLLMFHHLSRNGFCEVPTSHTCTLNMPISLLPSLFYSFVMSDATGMREFGLTLNHVYLNYSPSASCVDQNVCNNHTKENSPRPPAPYTCSMPCCSSLDWAFSQQLKIK